MTLFVTTEYLPIASFKIFTIARQEIHKASAAYPLT